MEMAEHTNWRCALCSFYWAHGTACNIRMCVALVKTSQMRVSQPNTYVRDALPNEMLFWHHAAKGKGEQ